MLEIAFSSWTTRYHACTLSWVWIPGLCCQAIQDLSGSCASPLFCDEEGQ